MVKVPLLLLVLASVVSIATCGPFPLTACPPCDVAKCPDITKLTCLWGVGKDSCDCCTVCLAGLGESCGTAPNLVSCGKDMICKGFVVSNRSYKAGQCVVVGPPPPKSNGTDVQTLKKQLKKLEKETHIVFKDLKEALVRHTERRKEKKRQAQSKIMKKIRKEKQKLLAEHRKRICSRRFKLREKKKSTEKDLDDDRLHHLAKVLHHAVLEKRKTERHLKHLDAKKRRIREMEIKQKHQLRLQIRRKHIEAANKKEKERHLALHKRLKNQIKEQLKAQRTVSAILHVLKPPSNKTRTTESDDDLLRSNVY